MSESPLLFHIKPPPTTRIIANLVRERGVEGLDEAQRRADQATYQEITCRSALNRVKGMPFDWTLNPYRGCTHACHYCYARRYQQQFELNADDQFSSVIFVKTNFVEVLRRELAGPMWRHDEVAVGAATDVYQPIEGSYKLTRRTLEALAEFHTPAGIVTACTPASTRRETIETRSARSSACSTRSTASCRAAAGRNRPANRPRPSPNLRGKFLPSAFCLLPSDF